MKTTPAIDARLKTLDGMLHGERPLSDLERLCVQRQITDLQEGWKRGLVWDEDEAQRIIKFCPYLRHWKGEFAGKRFNPEPWQAELILAPLFGWYREGEKGIRRRFTVGYVEVPRKNGKSFTAASIACQGLIADKEEGPEVYSAATTRDQASIIFRDAQNMLKPSKELAAHVEIMRHSIMCGRNNGVLCALSADYGFLQGKNPSRVLIDELHAHKTRDVWDALLTGMGARKNPLLIAFTTAGHDRSTICFEQHKALTSILEGHDQEDSMFGYISRAEPDDDIEDPAVWWKANPNLGSSVLRDYLKDESRKASRSPSYENTFRRLHLNIWTEQSVRWLPMEAWDACGGDVSDSELLGRVCYGGLDIGNTRDVTAMVMLFPMDNDTFVVRPIFWIPEDAYSDRAEQDTRRIRNWATEGYVRQTSGNVADLDGQIPDDILEEIRKYKTEVIAYDPWQAEGMRQKLVNRGVDEELMRPFRQTIAMFNEPTKKLENLVLSKKLMHGNNPVLRFMAANATIKEDVSGNIRPDKDKSAEKIDGIVATIMALGAYIEDMKNRQSVYSARDPIFISDEPEDQQGELEEWLFGG